MSDTEPDYRLRALRSLLGDSYPNKIQSSRISLNRRSKRSSQFAEISKENLAVVDLLIEIVEKLANDGKGTEAAKIIKIIKALLNNNQKLQQVVSEALLDIPN